MVGLSAKGSIARKICLFIALLFGLILLIVPPVIIEGVYGATKVVINPIWMPVADGLNGSEDIVESYSILVRYLIGLLFCGPFIVGFILLALFFSNKSGRLMKCCTFVTGLLFIVFGLFLIYRSLPLQYGKIVQAGFWRNHKCQSKTYYFSQIDQQVYLEIENKIRSYKTETIAKEAPIKEIVFDIKAKAYKWADTREIVTTETFCSKYQN